MTQIAFLQFLRDNLGITVFLSLPPGTIGTTNRKGSRGSPFATTNPFDIDPSFADRLLPEISALDQYRALLHSCHLLGMRTGSILSLATLAIDSPLFAVLPELGYWWRAENSTALVHCSTARSTSEFNLEAPELDESTSARFVAPPAAADVIVARGKQGEVRLIATDRSDRLRNIMLANAFPDVLAGGAATYTWGDVASVRYFEEVAPRPSGKNVSSDCRRASSAWDLMPSLVAWRYSELGETVFQIDVSASVPGEVLRRGRRLAASWRREYSERLKDLGRGALSSPEARALLDDLGASINRDPPPNDDDIFLIGEELWEFDSPHTELDAVCGPLTYCVSAHSHNLGLMLNSLRYHLEKLSERANDNPYIAAVANHDTAPPIPWIAGLLNVKYAFLPRAIPLIYSGADWGSSIVTNKEFGFNSTPELVDAGARLTDSRLALFNDIPEDWDSLAVSPSLHTFLALLDIARSLGPLDAWTYDLFDPGQQARARCFGYIRGFHERRLVVLVNWEDLPVQITWPMFTAKPLLSAPTAWRFCALDAGSEITIPARSAIVALASGDCAWWRRIGPSRMPRKSYDGS
ncbi:hypothetical protein ACTD5D_21075 [Nocardia takedensis]|uniref:hypothetical protein n=1 Tax=Nocardia takedensis TaxID=259390 RepID=UPI003F7728FC